MGRIPLSTSVYSTKGNAAYFEYPVRRPRRKKQRAPAVIISVTAPRPRDRLPTSYKTDHVVSVRHNRAQSRRTLSSTT